MHALQCSVRKLHLHLAFILGIFKFSVKIVHVNSITKGKMIMIKLIATDMDGTLLPEGTNQVDPEVYDVIRALQKNGVTFVAASGRNYESVMGVFGCMEHEITVISDNGAFVCRHGKELTCKSFPRELLEEVITVARKVPDAWIMASAARGAYTDQNNEKYITWVRDGYKMNLRLVDDLLQVEEPLIKVALYTYAADAATVAAPLREHFGDRLTIALAGEHWVDMVIPGINKGEALTHIQKSLGILPEETAAFGDNGNDIPMLRCAGESFAVANARPETKQAAKYILGDVSEAPVLSQLKKYLSLICPEPHREY